MELAIVITLIAVALIFDYINGFHDAANSIATVVSTRVLSPGQAVVWAAFFNFVAAFGFGTAVAKTIGSGMIDINVVTFAVIFSGLFGAITWDLITWYFGLPTSSSHALIGGYAGAAIAKAGFSAIIPAGWTKTLIFIVLSPLIGLTFGLGLMVAIYWLFRRTTPTRVDHWFRKLQLVSAALFSLNHGANDAQKTMGIIAGVLFTVPAYRAAGDRRGGHDDDPLLGRAARRTPPSASARCRAAGASSTRWGRASRSCSPCTASRPRPGRPGRCSWRPSSAFPSARRTRSPAPSWASAPRGGCRRCGGVSRDGSSGRGSSPSPRPRRSAWACSWRSGCSGSGRRAAASHRLYTDVTRLLHDLR